MKNLPNIHPGEILLEEFLQPMGISQNALARAAGVPPRQINEIVLGKSGITADRAVRLAAALGTSERFWLGLQADHDLEEAHWALGDAARIERIAACGPERRRAGAARLHLLLRWACVKSRRPDPCSLTIFTGSVSLPGACDHCK